MEFRFQFHNDAAEPADACVLCGRFSSERCLLRFRGVRLLVYICHHPCLAEISYLFWWFHESQLRASMQAREYRENGKADFRGIIYENSFAWVNGKPSPLRRENRDTKRSVLRSDKQSRRKNCGGV